MIITHEWIYTKNTRYSEKKVNNTLVQTNYFPTMYDTEVLNHNAEIISSTHVKLRSGGSNPRYRIHQPRDTPNGFAYYKFECRSYVDKADELGSGDAAYLFSFGGLDTMRGRAFRFPSDGEWHPQVFSGRLSNESEEHTISFSSGGIGSSEYEVRNFQIDYSNDPYDFFNGDTPDYSTNPPLVYHNGEWQEYVPKLYI